MARPGFSFLVCPDSTLLKEEMEKRAREEASTWKRLVFWGDEEPGPQFWNNLGQVGLFAESRILIVRQAEAWPAAIWKQVSHAVSRQLDHVWPFFCLEVGFEKGKFKIPAHIQKTACFGFAEKQGWIWKSQGLGQNLEKFAQAHAKKLGLVFEGNDFRHFCQIVPPDAQSVINELEKLALVAYNGKVSADMFPGNSSSKENDAFGLIRKLQNGDMPGAWLEIKKDVDGSLLFFLIALLAREFRLFWQIVAGESPRIYSGDARAKTDMARRLGFAGISTGFAALADAEWQVKSGRQRPEQVLEYLCADMVKLFRTN